MKRMLLLLVALSLPSVVMAQATLTLDDFNLGSEDKASGSSEMENCLLNQNNCQNSEFKSSTSFSIDDVVNLGIIDREEVKKTSQGSGAASQTASTLPSIDMEILFDYNSAELRPDQKPKLAKLSEILKGANFKDFRFLLLGHTDAKGSHDYNRVLSENRARAVADFVRSTGSIPASKVLVSGMGASKLKNLVDPFSAQNRRVQLVLVPVN
ncbi:MAG: OmpA family protein [Rhizobiales bacterium]|nr:OmpA family protein [Hyphomicrobiales bacterium]